MRRQGVGPGFIEQSRADLGRLPQDTDRRTAGRGENGQHALFQQAFTIAAAGGLGNGIKARHGPVDSRKVQINPRLDQLGADHTGGQAGFQPCLDLGDPA